jgi:hypothetical protein
MIFGLLIDKTSAVKLAAAERAKARRKARGVDPTSLRRPERQQDRELTENAVLWANGLPSRLRPNLLLARYPRVANRLALCWPDKGLTQHLFDDLLVDKRGGRRGFPPPVRAELVQLRGACPRAIPADSTTPHWEWHSQATSDR